MKINSETGLLENTPYLPSPNMDGRPGGTEIDLVVLHSISLPPGDFGGSWIERFFCNRLPADAHPYFAGIQQLKVSAHVLVKRDGTIVQFVPFHKRAWHAGESCFRGRLHCNDFSIGVELEGTDDQPFEDAQYETLAGLIRAMQRTWPRITRERITGHSDIAPGRKTDPGGGFDWARLEKLLA